MTDRLEPPPKRDAPGWNEARWEGERPRGATASSSGDHRDTPLNRFLGGSPAAVFFRLLIVSLVVGALLMWLDIRPVDILYGIERFFRRIWYLGFDAIREIATYILAGAVIVLPVWLVLRLINMRR